MDEFITNKIIGEDEEAYLERLNNEDLTNLQRQLNATNQAIAEVDTQQAKAKKELEDNLATLTNQKTKTLKALKNEKTSELNALKETEENEEDEKKSLEEEQTNKKSFKERFGEKLENLGDIFGEKFGEIKQKITEKIQEISSNIQKVSDNFQIDSDKLNADFNLAEAATVEKKEKLLTQQEKDTQNIQELEKTINTLKRKVVPKKKDNLEADSDKSNANSNIEADTPNIRQASLGLPAEYLNKLKDDATNKLKDLALSTIVRKEERVEFDKATEFWREGKGDTYKYPIEKLKLTRKDFLTNKSLKTLPGGKKQIQINFTSKDNRERYGHDPALTLGTATFTLHDDGTVTMNDTYNFDMKNLPLGNIKDFLISLTDGIDKKDLDNLNPLRKTLERNGVTALGKLYAGRGKPFKITGKTTIGKE